MEYKCRLLKKNIHFTKSMKLLQNKGLDSLKTPTVENVSYYQLNIYIKNML